jgi:hypothetical protein
MLGACIVGLKDNAATSNMLGVEAIKDHPNFLFVVNCTLDNPVLALQRLSRQIESWGEL